MTEKQKCAMAQIPTFLILAKDYAVEAGMDVHFISDIEHLISTVNANLEV